MGSPGRQTPVPAESPDSRGQDTSEVGTEMQSEVGNAQLSHVLGAGPAWGDGAGALWGGFISSPPLGFEDPRGLSVLCLAVRII